MTGTLGTARLPFTMFITCTGCDSILNVVSKRKNTKAYEVIAYPCGPSVLGCKSPWQPGGLHVSPVRKMNSPACRCEQIGRCCSVLRAGRPHDLELPGRGGRAADGGLAPPSPVPTCCLNPFSVTAWPSCSGLGIASGSEEASVSADWGAGLAAVVCLLPGPWGGRAGARMDF